MHYISRALRSPYISVYVCVIDPLYSPIATLAVVSEVQNRVEIVIRTEYRVDPSLIAFTYHHAEKSNKYSVRIQNKSKIRISSVTKLRICFRTDTDTPYHSKFVIQEPRASIIRPCPRDVNRIKVS